MQKMKTLRGLRWSPRPVAQYMTSGNLSHYAGTFQANPAVWNLFWISAGGLEEEPLTDHMAEVLARNAIETAAASVQGRLVKSWALSLMPHDFADLIEQHPAESAALPLARLLGEHWVWAIRHRGELFYNARTSDQGLGVPRPELQDETTAENSSTIVELSKFRGRMSK